MVETVTLRADEAEDASSPRGYEFTDRQNAVIRRTGRRSKTWGYLSLFSGYLMLASGAVAVVYVDQGPGVVVLGALYAISGAIPILIGLNFLRAARSFSGVTETSGLDIPHLMRAMESLGSALMVQIVTVLAGVVLFCLAVAAALTLPLLLGG